MLSYLTLITSWSMALLSPIFFFKCSPDFWVICTVLQSWVMGKVGLDTRLSFYHLFFVAFSLGILTKAPVSFLSTYEGSCLDHSVSNNLDLSSDAAQLDDSLRTIRLYKSKQQQNQLCTNLRKVKKCCYSIQWKIEILPRRDMVILLWSRIFGSWSGPVTFIHLLFHLFIQH